MSAYAIDWESVSDPKPDPRPGATGALVIVQLKGQEPPYFEEGWYRAMQGLLSETRAGVWDDPQLEGDRIVVPGVEPGSESALRQWLDGAVSQAIRFAGYAEEDARVEQAEREAPSSQLSDDELGGMGDAFRSSD